MKKQILLMGLFISLLPLTVLGQKKYYNMDFEKTDSIGKKVVQWQYQSQGTEFYVDSTTSATGKHSMFINLRQVEVTGGLSFYFVLPKVYYAGLRTMNISVKVMTRNEKPCAGLWCSVKKDKVLLAKASTYKGGIPFPINIFPVSGGTNVPVIPYSWTPYNFEIKVDKDPTEVIIGLAVLRDRAWFDDIIININGKPVNDLVFQMQPK
jgi:hypothetical protein